jgi:hypothetical protein
MISDYINIHGIPQTVVSDHRIQFISKVWQTRLTALGVSVTTTSVYHPQNNPAERVMRELGRFFRTYCHQSHTEWPRYVNYIEWVLNNTVHESTGFTPNEIFLKTERYSPTYEAIEYPRGVVMTLRLSSPWLPKFNAQRLLSRISFFWFIFFS